MVAIAVAVSIVTYGAMTGTSATLMSTIGAGAAAGAAGSVASQAVGSVMGVTSFSWKNVAVAAAAGAVGGAFSFAAKAEMLGQPLKNMTYLRNAAGAAVGNVASYAASRIIGNDAHFSWTNIAISAVSAGAGSWLGDTAASAFNINSEFGQTLAQGLAGGLVSGHLNRLAYGNRVDYAQIVGDAFGTALGNMAGGSSTPASLGANGSHISDRQPIADGVGRSYAPLMDEYAPIRDLAPVTVYTDPTRTWREFSKWQWYQDAGRYAAANRRDTPITGMSRDQMVSWYAGEAKWHDGMVRSQLSAEYAASHPKGFHDAPPQPTTWDWVKRLTLGYHLTQFGRNLAADTALALGGGEVIRDEAGRQNYIVKPLTGEWVTRGDVQNARVGLLTNLFPGSAAGKAALNEAKGGAYIGREFIEEISTGSKIFDSLERQQISAQGVESLNSTSRRAVEGNLNALDIDLGAAGKIKTVEISNAKREVPIGGKIGPWEDEASGLRKGDVFMQCADGSCVSATGQVMTNGAVSERQLLERLGEWSNPEALARELNRLLPESRFTGGYFATAEDALAIAQSGRFGAVLQARGAPGHMVTIEPIGKNGSFRVFDTGIGASYKVQPRWIEKYVSGGVWENSQ